MTGLQIDELSAIIDKTVNHIILSKSCLNFIL
ncbi:MAG: hypothetical protein PWP51_1724 [Clostridiales bacterium]|jgi:hypothetical protein|nr:hypothetical protein [Clostridiales bacterium]MDN5299171.1 hypothetical protein [Clostridiales bacterium]